MTEVFNINLTFVLNTYTPVPFLYEILGYAANYSSIHIYYKDNSIASTFNFFDATRMKSYINGILSRNLMLPYFFVFVKSRNHLFGITLG